MSGLTLDATCSSKRIWPAHADVRIDISPAAKPDFLMDARRTAFRDGTFAEIYCDPPHNVFPPSAVGFAAEHTGARGNPNYTRFSAWPSRAAWFEFLDGVNREFARILRPDGVLRFKCPDGTRTHSRSIARRDLTRLTNCECAADELVAQRGPFAAINRKMGRVVTPMHIVAFKKRIYTANMTIPEIGL